MIEAPPQTQETATIKPRPTKVRLEEGQMILEKNKFTEALEGFEFWTVQFKDLPSMVEHFNGLGKDGADLVCGIANSQLKFAMRNKARSKLPDDQVERLAKLNRGESTLINEQEAREYVPGERDITSISGLQKVIKECTEAIKEAKANNEVETAAELRKDLEEYVEQLQDLILSAV